MDKKFNLEFKFQVLIGAVLALFLVAEIMSCGPGFDPAAATQGSSSTATPTATPTPTATATATPTPTPSSTPWYNSSWLYRRKLTFDNSAQSSNLTSFPVMVKLNNTRIDYSKTQDLGQDIRFTDSDATTALSYEIEKWDETGTSVCWVKVPQIDGSSATDYIYVYYGNTAATDGQSANAVWSDSFDGVWHLQTSLADSTSSGLTGTDDGSGNDANGKISNGRSFNGTTGTVYPGGGSGFANTVAILKNVSSATISFWKKTSALGAGTTWMFAASKGGGGGDSLSSRAAVGVTNTGNLVTDAMAGDGEAVQTRTTTGTPVSSTGTWYYVTSTINYGTSTIAMYVDGAVAASAGAISFTAGATSNTNSEVVAFGADDTGKTGYWSGTLDEIRVSTTARSTDWIALDYKSVNDTLITFGSEETVQ